MAAKKSRIKLILIILAKGEKKSSLLCSSYKLSSAKFRGKNDEYLIWYQTGIKIIKNSKRIQNYQEDYLIHGFKVLMVKNESRLRIYISVV